MFKQTTNVNLRKVQLHKSWKQRAVKYSICLLKQKIPNVVDSIQPVNVYIHKKHE